MRLLLAFMVGCGLLVSQGYAADTTVIAAFGDSLFAGYGLEAPYAFPLQLEAKLKQDGYNVQILNDGVSGDTTAGGVSRVDYVISQKPNLVLLELGANDLMRGVPPTETKNNLNIILQKLRAANIAVILIGEKAPLTLGAAYANAYNAVFTDLAKDYNVPVVPFFLESVYDKPGLMQPDGVHPTNEGVAALVVSTYPLIEKSLKK